MEKLGNGNYKFKANNALVAAIDGRLFAIVIKDQIPSTATTEWTLKRDEMDTQENAYMYVLQYRTPLYRTHSFSILEYGWLASRWGGLPLRAITNRYALIYRRSPSMMLESSPIGSFL